MSAFPGPEQAKASSMPRKNGFGLDDVNGRSPAAHERESQAQNIRSTRVKRRRGRRDRFTTVSWCRSAMISRCSETRDRNMNRIEWSSEKTTDATRRGYRRTSITSIDATRTMFSIATGRFLYSGDDVSATALYALLHRIGQPSRAPGRLHTESECAVGYPARPPVDMDVSGPLGTDSVPHSRSGPEITDGF